MLVNFFSDNHQQVEDNDLKSLSGPPLRVDPPRNPFGSGGVQNPFVYNRRLVAADFQGVIWLRRKPTPRLPCSRENRSFLVWPDRRRPRTSRSPLPTPKTSLCSATLSHAGLVIDLKHADLKNFVEDLYKVDALLRGETTAPNQ